MSEPVDPLTAFLDALRLVETAPPSKMRAAIIAVGHAAAEAFRAHESALTIMRRDVALLHGREATRAPYVALFPTPDP